MDKIVLKPTRSDISYQGLFADLAFGILANPVPLYQNLLKHLGGYGADLYSLKYDGTVLSEANVSCSILALNALIRVRLDRLEVSFLRLHEIGEELAARVLQECWAAIQSTEASISVREHRYAISLSAQLEGISYNDVIRRYVKTPEKLPEQTRAGIVFYVPENASKGERQGSIVLDLDPSTEEQLHLKLTVNLEQRQVPFNLLSQHVKQYVERCFDALGFSLNPSNKR